MCTLIEPFLKWKSSHWAWHTVPMSKSVIHAKIRYLARFNIHLFLSEFRVFFHSFSWWHEPPEKMYLFLKRSFTKVHNKNKWCVSKSITNNSFKNWNNPWTIFQKKEKKKIGRLFFFLFYATRKLNLSQRSLIYRVCNNFNLVR